MSDHLMGLLADELMRRVIQTIRVPLAVRHRVAYMTPAEREAIGAVNELERWYQDWRAAIFSPIAVADEQRGERWTGRWTTDERPTVD